VSRSGGVEGLERVYGREWQEMARVRTSGRSRHLSHPRLLPIGILMPRVNETASCTEETNTLASPRLLSVCSVPKHLGVFVCAKRAAAAEREGGGSAAADSPVAAGWLGKGCGTHALHLLHKAAQSGKQRCA